MFARINTLSLIGLAASTVQVEADIAFGLPSFTIVGLAATSILESRERIRSAIRNSGYSFPTHRITINLAPAYLRKQAAHFDLSIAMSILLASGVAPEDAAKRLFCGELSLDGRLQPVAGILPLLLEAQRLGYKEVIIPLSNSKEAALLPSSAMKIRSARDLRSVVRYLQGLTDLVLVRHTPGELSNGTAYPVDISTIIGQQQAKRAVEIAASGGHHIVLAGPPGVGKTLLAHSLQSILPPLTVHERLEVASIYSLSRSHPQVNLGTIVPFRSPHHTASETVLLGGSSTPRPGEVSLAHNGILFLDEMPEFSAVSLESLRQPLEAKCITINRPTATVTYPADFLLVGAHNPCPCGYLGDSRRECTCSAVQIARYKSRLSGPLLDRIDLQVSLVAETQDINIAPTETSKQVQTRVLTTRAIQLKRYASDTFAKNSQIPAGMLSRYCSLAHSEAVMLERITRHYQLSLRGSHKVLRVARTIADMAGSESILEQHLAEACLYRF